MWSVCDAASRAANRPQLASRGTGVFSSRASGKCELWKALIYAGPDYRGGQRATSERPNARTSPPGSGCCALEAVMLLEVLAVLGGAALVSAAVSVRVVKQFERGLVFRFGRIRDRVRGPGLAVMVPFADRLHKVNVQIVTMAVPAPERITRDNVTVKVDAVVYFRVVDPVRAIVNVEDYPFAVSQVAQTSLRSIIGKSD